MNTEARMSNLKGLAELEMNSNQHSWNFTDNDNPSSLDGPFTSRTSPPRLNSSSFLTRGILNRQGPLGCSELLGLIWAASLLLQYQCIDCATACDDRVVVCECVCVCVRVCGK